MTNRKNVMSYGAFDRTFQTKEASPGRLVLLLFDRACTALTTIKLTPFSELQNCEPQEKFDHIARYHQEGAKVLEILTALEGLVDLQQGGSVAQQLLETYRIIKRAFWGALQAKNLSEIEKISEALQELREGWRSVVLQENGKPPNFSVSAG